MLVQKNLKTICFDVLGVCVQGGSVNQEVLTIIQKTKNRGFRVIAYTNSWKGSIESIERATPFLKNFDAVYYADTLAPKNENGYRLLAKTEHIAPEECLVVDDTETNIASAARANFETYHFRTDETHASEKLSDFLDTLKPSS